MLCVFLKCVYVCVYSSNGMPPSSIQQTHITSRQLGNIYVRVIVYVCVCVGGCVGSDPPSVFSCNPQQRFHFPVITCIDFPQPCSDTHIHTRRYPMILKGTHTDSHAYIHLYALIHTYFGYTRTYAVCLHWTGNIVFKSSPVGVRLVLTYGPHFCNHTLAGA